MKEYEVTGHIVLDVTFRVHANDFDEVEAICERREDDIFSLLNDRNCQVVSVDFSDVEEL